ncbi:hypothetical protein JW906_07390 [bacterium]|nr:hypothetical protein [bacterium]
MKPKNHFPVKILFRMLVLSAWIRCDSYDPTAPGPQPAVLEPVRHETMLNVFGVLRPDTLDGRPRSFVHLEFAYPATDFPDSTLVTDADVRIRKLGGESAADSCVLAYTDIDGAFVREYRHASFFPDTGTYALTCRRQGFPVLTAETTIPGMPVIQDGIFITADRLLSFHVARDEYCGMVEIEVACGDRRVSNRFLRPESGHVPVRLQLDSGFKGSCTLTVYAYDLNLSGYLTANLSIKPNIYQADFSTVTNGYGCFGSMNILKREIGL